MIRKNATSVLGLVLLFAVIFLLACLVKVTNGGYS